MLDYQNVAHVLLPLVGATYALHFMGESMMDMYHKFEADRCEQGVVKCKRVRGGGGVYHSGLKALCTWITADWIERTSFFPSPLSPFPAPPSLCTAPLKQGQGRLQCTA